MTREPIEVTRQDRIYCLKVSSDYHSEVCEECRFYPNCDHMTQDDMTELTIKDLEVLEQEPFIDKPCVSSGVCEHDKNKVLDKIREQIKSHLRGVEITLEVLAENHPLRPKMKGAKDTLEECLEIIDKAESEDKG